MKINKDPGKSDWIGIVGSLGCILHCVALPMVLYVFEVAVDTEIRVLDYLFAAIALGAVSYSLRNVTLFSTKIVLICSLLLLIGGVLLEESFQSATFLLHLGSVGLVIGHSLNLIQHRRAANASNLPLQSNSISPAKEIPYTSLSSSR